MMNNEDRELIRSLIAAIGALTYAVQNSSVATISHGGRLTVAYGGAGGGAGGVGRGGAGCSATTSLIGGGVR